jgi:hypothetical protein
MGWLSRSVLVVTLGTSPPLCAADLNGDIGWAPGITNNEHFSTSKSLATFGIWGTVGIGSVYLEARAFASDYRYLVDGSTRGSDSTYPAFDTTIYVFELGLLYAPAIQLSPHIKLSPHIGGGLSAVDLKTEMWLSSTQSGGSSKDQSLGHYVHVGASLLFLRDRLRAGFDYQRVGGTHVTMFGAEGTADHDQFTLLVSYHWGGTR